MAKLEPHPLMRTIVDHPDADLPRLVYADWLDEQGDPKLAMLAEYIRLGVELETVPQRSAEWNEIEQRQRELVQSDWQALRPPMPKWAMKAVSLHRGLPWSMSCTLKRFAQGGARVLEFAPITSVVLWNMDRRGAHARYAPPALQRPELLRVRCLSVMDPLDDFAILALAGNTAASQILELDLYHTLLTQIGAKALASSPHLTQLEYFTVNINVPPDVRRTLRKKFGERLNVSGIRGDLAPFRHA